MSTGMMDGWLSNLKNEAEKQREMEEINKLIESDADYRKQVELINRQIKMVEDKKIELINEKEQLKCDFGNKYLKQRKSKYRMKIGTKEDALKSVFGGL